MDPILLQSTLSSMILPPPPSDCLIRGRKRTNESIEGHLFAKRNSNSDMSDDDSASNKGISPGSPGVDDERRAHHNELERRRRDHIKDHFTSLKDAIPLLEGEKSSRALILKRAVEYISIINQRVSEQAMIIEELQRKNEALVHCKEPSTSPCLMAPAPVLPTTSTASAVAPLVIEPLCVSPSATSSFSPVIPSQPAAVLHYQPTPAAPAAGPTLAELTMLFALQQQQQMQKPTMEQLLTKDLATLLSLNSLKDHSAHYMTPLLF